MTIDPGGDVVAVGALQAKTYHPAVVYPATSWAASLKFPPLLPPETKDRKYKIFIVFAKDGTVEIQPTADSKFR
jgi:hypothetical protein